MFGQQNVSFQFWKIVFQIFLRFLFLQYVSQQKKISVQPQKEIHYTSRCCVIFSKLELLVGYGWKKKKKSKMKLQF